MKLHIKYFGMLTEITQRQEETLDFENQTVSELLGVLQEKYPQLKEANFKVAQNYKIVNAQDIISQPEIALLPPFAGG